MTNYNSSKGNGYQLRVSITTKSQSPSTNESTLNWAVYIINPPTNYAIAKTTASLSLGGKSVWSISGQTISTGGAGQTKLLASGTRVVKHGGDGTVSVAVSGSIRHDPQNPGMGWNIPTLTATGTYKPKALSKPTGKPAAPAVSKNATTRKITATAQIPASERPITGHQIRRRHNGSGTYSGWLTVDADSNRQITFTPAHLNADYQFQSRALTSAGPGEWSNSTTYPNRDCTIWVRHSGTWKLAIPYVKTKDKWQVAEAYIKDAGTWKKAGA